MNMQIECLEKSIKEKWIPIVEGKLKERGDDCPCCQAYIDCQGCPIEEDTGGNCSGSPYWIFDDLECETLWMHEINYDLMFDLKAAAQMELDYLNDLLNRLKARK